MRENQFAFKGIWIPKEILEMTTSGEITSTDLLLLSMIFAMSKNGSCYASREYLAEKINKSVSHVKNLIARYRKMGLIIDVSFDGRRQKIRTYWDQPYRGQYGRGTVDSTAEATSGSPSSEGGTVDSTADQAINNKNNISIGEKEKLREATASPNPTVLLRTTNDGSGLSEHLKRKAERKANKGSWRNGGNKKSTNNSAQLSRDEGLAISLTDNITDELVENLSKKYNFTREDVEEQKEKYINWILGSSHDPKMWGKNMAIYLDIFCERSFSKKAKVKVSKPKDMFEEINAIYKKFPK